MVSYSQLLNMDLSRLRAAASNVGGLSSSLSSRGTEVAGKAEIPGGMWSGGDANAASSLLSPQSSPLWDASDALRGGKGILQDLATDLDSAKERLGDAHDAVAGTKAYIDADGTVTVPPGLDEDENERATKAARQARDIIDEALENANNSDDKASSALRSSMVPGYPFPVPREDPRSKQYWRDMNQHLQRKLHPVKEHFKEHGVLGGPGTGGSYGPSGSRKFGARRGLSSDEGGGKGSTSWRLFQAGYNPISYDKGPFYTSAGANAGITGTYGKLFSIDASVGAAASAGLQGSKEVGAFTFNGNAGVQAGANAGYGADIGFKDKNTFTVATGGKLSWGAGATGGGSVDIDLKKLNPW